MAKKKRIKTKRKSKEKNKKSKNIKKLKKDSLVPKIKKNNFRLPEEIKKWIFGIIIFIFAIIFILSFFDLAGIAGSFIMKSFSFLVGKAVYFVPLIFILGGMILLNAKKKQFFGLTILSIFILITGFAGMIETFGSEAREGGFIGYFLTLPFLKFFGELVARIIFLAMIGIGGLIFWYLIRVPKTRQEVRDDQDSEPEEKKPSLIKKVFSPNFNVKQLEPKSKEKPLKTEEPVQELKQKETVVAKSLASQNYKLPPLELLESDKGKPAAGDVVANSEIIKKTLENFGVPVEMSGSNTGPTVTQYTLKPAEGVKLSKITGLSNNISLALASHPIRIEAPIPGKSLVGIEVPNKSRSQISLRDLMASPYFYQDSSGLNIALGKNVAGSACYADLARMPHLLVGGSTGTGKTIFLNSLILSLLYQNSPDSLRLILVDPKRVEFSAYKDLPHLLTPVIFEAQKAINALKWLVLEMEKRFDILSVNGSRNIISYNEKIIKQGEKPLSYIVVIIDELADLMAAKGREMEAAIVRLAQMARAVGIHLVVATQRPSVEVITGLIKANITSRVTFQVASQVDSRTVLDTSGAEKLLGRGDMLFISAESSKPRRIQGSFVSEKEVKKVVDYIKAQKEKIVADEAVDFENNNLIGDLEKNLEFGNGEINLEDYSDDDPFYKDAKNIVIEAKKASASLLQRRLRVGYARAARLLDILEERGVIGPGEGAKPREVYGSETASPIEIKEGSEMDEDGWKKI